MYNLSFEKGIVPDKLKTAKVIPVYKGGDSCLPQNYRPISLLKVFDKLLEKLMAVRLNRFSYLIISPLKRRHSRWKLSQELKGK